MAKVNAIEFGAVAAVIMAIATVGWHILNVENPAVIGARCETVEFDTQGAMQLSCTPQRSDLNLWTTTDLIFALSQAVHPRPMTCDLYKTQPARCKHIS